MTKKVKIISAISIAASIVSLFAISLNTNSSFAVKAGTSITWAHYEYVSPGFETGGSNEYWISCDRSHTISFTHPSGGTYIERGKPSQELINSFKAYNDGRYITKRKIDDNHLWFGMYPQSLVDDDDLWNELDEATTYRNGYAVYNNELYSKRTASPYEVGMQYFNNDTTVIDNGHSYWFKVEPIVWTILNVDNNDYFLTATSIIDVSVYNELYEGTQSRKDYQGDNGTVYANNYKFSNLRKVLNTDFHERAFEMVYPHEEELIRITNVDNSESGNPYSCENTNDEVFALSYKEIFAYSSLCFDESDSRSCVPTDFAKAGGAYSTSNGIGRYFSRTPEWSDETEFVGILGGADDEYYTNSKGFGIRPALHIALS